MQWLGPLVAEPERSKDRVDYYLRNQNNSRVPDALCTVVTEADLDGILKKDFEAIEAKLKAVTPQGKNDVIFIRMQWTKWLRIEGDARRRRHLSHEVAR